MAGGERRGVAGVDDGTENAKIGGSRADGLRKLVRARLQSARERDQAEQRAALASATTPSVLRRPSSSAAYRAFRATSLHSHCERGSNAARANSLFVYIAQPAALLLGNGQRRNGCIRLSNSASKDSIRPRAMQRQRSAPARHRHRRVHRPARSLVAPAPQSHVARTDPSAPHVCTSSSARRRSHLCRSVRLVAHGVAVAIASGPAISRRPTLPPPILVVLHDRNLRTEEGGHVVSGHRH